MELGMKESYIQQGRESERKTSKKRLVQPVLKPRVKRSQVSIRITSFIVMARYLNPTESKKRWLDREAPVGYVAGLGRGCVSLAFFRSQRAKE